MKHYDLAAFHGLIREWRLGPVHVALFRHWMFGYMSIPPLTQINLGWLGITVVR